MTNTTASTDGYQKIQQHVGWYHTYDIWGGKQIENGAYMAIRWPDKTESNEIVKVSRSHHITGTNEYAYIDGVNRGVKVWIHLLGLQAKLLKKPVPSPKA